LIVTCARTYEIAKGGFVFNYLAEVELKGKREKVKIYELLDVSS